MENGLIHVYFGDGKGKTTAALGMGLRACGRGLRVLMVQLMKGRDSGEITAAAMLPNFQVVQGPERIPFYFQMNSMEKSDYRSLARSMISQAQNMAAGGEADLVILDEILDAISCGIVETSEVAAFLQNKPSGLEVVLTGRNPPEEILELADYITEIRKLRHPFDRGTAARIGIEK